LDNDEIQRPIVDQRCYPYNLGRDHQEVHSGESTGCVLERQEAIYGLGFGKSVEVGGKNFVGEIITVKTTPDLKNKKRPPQSMRQPLSSDNLKKS